MKAENSKRQEKDRTTDHTDKIHLCYPCDPWLSPLSVPCYAMMS